MPSTCKRCYGNIFGSLHWRRSQTKFQVRDFVLCHNNNSTPRGMNPFLSIRIFKRYTILSKLLRLIGYQVNRLSNWLDVYLSRCCSLFHLTHHIWNIISKSRLCSTQHNLPRSWMRTIHHLWRTHQTTCQEKGILFYGSS